MQFESQESHFHLNKNEIQTEQILTQKIYFRKNKKIKKKKPINQFLNKKKSTRRK